VIIDTPPIGLLSDASLLAHVADGTLLVVKAEETPYDVVQRAVSALGKSRILGVVLNQATDVGPAGKYHSYYHATRESQG
jgi:Mrp family chromosome partitioning ATPase